MQWDATALACWTLAWAIGVLVVGLWVWSAGRAEAEMKRPRRRTQGHPDYRPVGPAMKLIEQFRVALMLDGNVGDLPWYQLPRLGLVPEHRREHVVMCRCGRCVDVEQLDEDMGPAKQTINTVRLSRLPFGLGHVEHPDDPPGTYRARKRWSFWVGQCHRCRCCLWAVEWTRARNRRIQSGGVVLAPGRV